LTENSLKRAVWDGVSSIVSSLIAARYFSSDFWQRLQSLPFKSEFLDIESRLIFPVEQLGRGEGSKWYRNGIDEAMKR